MIQNLFLTFVAVLALSGCSVKDADAVALPSAAPASPSAALPESKQNAEPVEAASPSDPTAGGVPYSGTVEAHRRSTMSPKVSSTVSEVHVRDGDRVKKGDPLVTFDLKDVNLKLRQSRATLENAKIQRDAASLDWDRTKKLVESNAAAKAQFDAVDFRKRGAEVGVTSAEVSVEISEKAVRDSVVRAPYDGVIVRRLVNEGDYATTMPPTSLIIIEETGILDLRVQAPSSEIGNIREGDPVEVNFPSLGRTIRSTVTRIVASIDSRTRNFSVIIEIPNPDGALLPGLFAEARFERKGAGGATP